MDIIFFGNGGRSTPCLKLLKHFKYNICAIVAHPKKESKWFEPLEREAKKLKIPIHTPKNPNGKTFEKILKSYQSDLFILAGYGKILKGNIIDIPNSMCINLHGGKLPKYRGSSPLNWALINGESSFTLSIIKLVKQIDGGPILLEKDFSIGDNETIQDLHKIANVEFPEMLIKVLKDVENNSLKIKKQIEKNSSYYPLRTPDDGFILWDKYNAQEIHNRIRALTNPYPCAFSFFKEKKVKFISSIINKKSFSGEPGRIYQIKKNKFLVSARKGSVWITEAVYSKTKLPFFPTHDRYQSFSTINQIALSLYKNNILNEDKK